MCDWTYVNGNRRKFFEKTFFAVSRLDDAKEKSTITAPHRDGFLVISQELADANQPTIKAKGVGDQVIWKGRLRLVEADPAYTPPRM